MSLSRFFVGILIIASVLVLGVWLTKQENRPRYYCVDGSSNPACPR
jgi:hypothetical protein